MIERDGTSPITTLNRIRADLAAADDPAEFERIAGMHVTWLMGLAQEAEKWRADAMRVATERNGAYRERAQLVAWAAAVYKSGWNTDPAWPDWRIVFVDSPAGQLSWHVAPDDWGLFEHVKHDPAMVWDGHTTEQKYERIAELVKWLSGIEAKDPWLPGQTARVLAAMPEAAETIVRWQIRYQDTDGEWYLLAWDLDSEKVAIEERDRRAADMSPGRTYPLQVVKVTALYYEEAAA